jgi:raffinose/stachyose/melibiose transport system substrate-binding protein
MTGRRLRGAIGAATIAALAVAATGCSAEDGRTELLFFQFKPEAAQQFEELAEQFEAENPDIEIIVDNVPEPETALRTRLVKGDVPDVLTLNANGTFGELASAGIFRDFSGEPVLEDVKDVYVEIVQDLGAGSPDAVNGVPFAANASGVLYNEELFAQYGVEVPRTWEELIQAAETFQENGVVPFYGMLGDAWTAQSPLAPLTAQTQPQDFFQARFADQTTFEEGWLEATQKLGTLFEYTQPDPAATGYEDGTREFAEGQSAMLLLGSYAVPQIRTFDPQFTIGSFALPATDDPTQTTLVSGVDVVITAGAGGAHPEESMRFIEFLMQPQVVEEYAEAQVAIPTVEGTTNTDPALAGIRSYIEEERVVGFTDHQFIPAIPLGALLQQYLIDENAEAFVQGLDASWDRVAERRTWGLGAVES